MNHSPVLLIVGCGDVGMRLLPLLRQRWRLRVLSHSGTRVAELRAAGVTPLVGDLDDPATLGRLGALADAVIHLAPPPGQGALDLRSRHLGRALLRGGRVRRLVYVSTSGVYGDAGGQQVAETRPIAPATDRAWRRADAEAWWRWWGRACGAAVSILRVPGIYALDRAGGDPRERVRRGAPVLCAEDDVYTCHIQADDLARACVAALHRGRPQRVVNVCDDSALRMGEYLDLVADRCGLARPPRISRAEAEATLTPLTLSFLRESRRLCNQRMKRELRLRLRCPTVAEGLAASSAPASAPT